MVLCGTLWYSVVLCVPHRMVLCGTLQYSVWYSGHSGLEPSQRYINCLETPWWDCDADDLVQCNGTQWSNGTLEVHCIDGRTKWVQNETLSRTLCIAECL